MREGAGLLSLASSKREFPGKRRFARLGGHAEG